MATDTNSPDQRVGILIGGRREDNTAKLNAIIKQTGGGKTTVAEAVKIIQNNSAQGPIKVKK